MILDPNNDPAKQAHNAGFMITTDEVDAIVKEWPEEWCVPLTERLAEGEDQGDPPNDQGNGQNNG